MPVRWCDALDLQGDMFRDTFSWSVHDPTDLTVVLLIDAPTNRRIRTALDEELRP